MRHDNGMDFPRITPHQLKQWLHDGNELALLDVREHGQYGESHLFHATNLPFSRLELDAARLLPRRSVRIVLYDAGDDGLALDAALALRDIGYCGVHLLDGGTRRWAADGYPLFAGVHVPSKAFGELVESHCHTPSVDAQSLQAWREEGRELVILDGRPFSEYRKMNIPGAICCPNGELALRVDQLVPDAETTVVVNCAGRTRSIIGAQTLIGLGLSNPVYALENGSQGWALAGLALEHGSDRRYPDDVPAARLPVLRRRAEWFAQRQGVGYVAPDAVLAAQEEAQATTYLLDVRTEEEYRAGTIPGAQHAPGGQLIQATDQYLAVRGARLVLFDDDGIRAPVIAGWLRQMGWDASVLQDASRLFSRAAAMAASDTSLDPARDLDAAALAACLGSSARILDLRSSMAYRDAHIAQSAWSSRPLLRQWRHPEPVVLIAAERGVAALAARTLRRSGIAIEGIHVGNPQDWRAAGLSVTATPDVPADTQCIDYLFFVHDRHEGNLAAARRYLEWEMGLVAQLDAKELAAFRIRP